MASRVVNLFQVFKWLLPRPFRRITTYGNYSPMKCLLQRIRLNRCSQGVSAGLQSRCWEGQVPSGCSRGKFPCTNQVLKASCISWFIFPFSHHFNLSQSYLLFWLYCLHSSLIKPLWLHWTTQILHNSLSISRALTPSAKSLFITHACSVTESCPTLCDTMDVSPPGSSVHGLSQARILEWVAISSSSGSFPPRDPTCVSYTGRQILHHWATWEAPTFVIKGNIFTGPED